MQRNMQIKNKITKWQFWLIAAAFLCFLSLDVPAQQASRTERVRFRRGATSATLTGTTSKSVNTYLLRVRRGQQISVRVSGTGEPAFSVGYYTEGYIDPVAEDQRNWSGTAAGSTDYVFEVKGGRGNSRYRIVFTVK